MRTLTLLACALLLAGCGAYSPDSQVIVAKAFYENCRSDGGAVNDCISQVRDEFWLYGEDLEFVVGGDLPQ